MTLVTILLLLLILFKYQKRYEVIEVCGKVEVRGTFVTIARWKASGLLF